jgi:hypothetical protein
MALASREIDYGWMIKVRLVSKYFQLVKNQNLI